MTTGEEDEDSDGSESGSDSASKPSFRKRTVITNHDRYEEPERQRTGETDSEEEREFERKTKAEVDQVRDRMVAGEMPEESIPIQQPGIDLEKLSQAAQSISFK